MNLIQVAGSGGIHALPRGFPRPQTPWRAYEECEPELFAGMVDEEHPMWKTERIEFKSVGIDIGEVMEKIEVVPSGITANCYNLSVHSDQQGESYAGSTIH